MFNQLNEINNRPKPFQYYTVRDLWTDEYVSKQMLAFHLDEEGGLASRTKNFIDKSVRWIAGRFGLDNTKDVIDFGCGPGLYTSRFAAAGAGVTGLDFSRRSLEYAREEAEKMNLAIKYIETDYLEFETEKAFDLITMIFCDFCVLNADRRAGLLKKFHQLLKPGGSVLLDVHSVNLYDQQEETASYECNPDGGFWSSHAYYAFLNIFKYADEKVLLHKHTIIEENRKRIIYNWLQCFSRERLAGEFSAAGFTGLEFCSDVAGTAYDSSSQDIAVIARKE